jgi:hypothetical protein
MTDYSLSAVYDIRNAMWKELTDAGIFDINNYYADGLPEAIIPIIPAQQIPELINLLPGQDFIVYHVEQKKTGIQWWVTQESIILDIVSNKTDRIMTITNFLTDLFRRYDLSAKTINADVDSSSPFTYLYFNIELSNPIQMFTDEGGYMSGDFTVGYAYTRDIGDEYTGRFA